LDFAAKLVSASGTRRSVKPARKLHNSNNCIIETIKRPVAVKKSLGRNSAILDEDGSAVNQHFSF
jgi:hypothetical protein